MTRVLGTSQMPQEQSNGRWHRSARVELLQAETLLGLAGRLGDLPDALDFGHEQVVVGVKMALRIQRRCETARQPVCSRS